MEMGMKPSAIVIGSGPNGLAGAIALAQAGFEVEVREASEQPGGGARSGDLTLPGFIHDLGSAVHPLAVGSPFFSSLSLQDHGLKWIWPEAQLAHPLDDGSAVTLESDIGQTASQLGHDGTAYRKLFEPLVKDWPRLAREVLRPLRLPQHPLLLSRFGIRAIQPCTVVAKRLFRSNRAQVLFAGICAHSTLKLEAPLSAAFGMILGAAGHAVGWPIPQSGAQRISDALISLLNSLGGRLVTAAPVRHLREIRGYDLTLCDVTPRQFLELADGELRRPFRQLLEQYEYGPGVCKVDWALREPIPWRAKECARAITVHLGGSLEELAVSERAANEGRPPERPFVLLAQPSLFDSTRAPAGKHTAWSYCHVPNGWTGSAVTQIESQIERFAPGFRECILGRSIRGPADMQCWNSNLVGGDINGGVPNIKQFALRPTWRRYGTPLKGVYLCSSSTPPGGAVHGMCGYWAAQWALQYFDKRKNRH
jgi:phytoene dehydrogenase-like protein